MRQQDLIPHLFRTEYSKIVAVLIKRFGFAQIEVAEDLASDTFLKAAQRWPFTQIPPNPTAWLYTVAKNKAKNYLQRQHVLDNKIAKENARLLPVEAEEIDLSAKSIYDSQLQMMFAICHPSIPPDAQVGLSLRILCGFGIDEIAHAFLTSKETINKRLLRAKEKLRQEKVLIEFPGTSEIQERLDRVLTTIYLLFSEGYYSGSKNTVIRKELCLEAMRLCKMLIENDSTNIPKTNALLALMCFHASRFEARLSSDGELVLYPDQDTRLWNEQLIIEGGYYLHLASKGNHLSTYHIEASIAYWHTQKADTPEKWKTILQLYNHLLQLEYSPIASLNRIYALAKVSGKQQAIAEAEKLPLTSNHFYYLLLGELYTGIDNEKATLNFTQALDLAKTQPDKLSIQNKIESLEGD